MGLVLGVAGHFLAETADSLKRRWSPDSYIYIMDDAPAGGSGDNDICSTAHSSTTAQIKPGSHIYSYRVWGLYSHHGIYEGNGHVIHYTRTEAKAFTFSSRWWWSSGVLQYDDAVSKGLNHCPKCDYTSIDAGDDHHQPVVAVADVPFPRGVIRTCLKCFLRDGSKIQRLHLYSYGVPWWRLWFGVRGSCTATAAKESREVVQRAQKLLGHQGFGSYDLFHNNCEHFATFCCTGMRISEQAQGWAWFNLRLRRLMRLPSRGVLMPSKPLWLELSEGYSFFSVLIINKRKN